VTRVDDGVALVPAPTDVATAVVVSVERAARFAVGHEV